MAVQTRSTALQNEVVRLYCTFIQNGLLANPLGQPMVEILDSDGVTILASIPAAMENTGIFYADYFVPQNLPLGNYYDKWSFQWDATASAQELTMVITVHSFESYINFLNTGKAIRTSNIASQLLLELSNNFIYESQHIPIYAEQGMRVQQDNQAKRIKNYYYLTLTSDASWAQASATYTNNGKTFTVFESIEEPSSSTSSSSNSQLSSIDSSISSLTSAGSSQSSDSTQSSDSSISSGSSLSSDSSSSLDSSSSSSYQITPTTTTEYVPKIILTLVGTGDPSASGTLIKTSGEGSDTIGFSSWQKKVSRLSTVYSFAYKNWNQEPAPIVRVNNRIVDDGWHLDYDGKIYFDTLMAPEDSVVVSYNFAYFAQDELLSFLQFGLNMMNGLPPASTVYNSLDTAPRLWWAGILLYAAITALKRLIFGLSWQEKRIIYGRPEDAQSALSAWQDLYKSYMETWTEFGKNAKTLKLPGIALSIQPEYTLPGGRCMSSDTFIKCEISGERQLVTIKELYTISLNKTINVESMKDGEISFEVVEKVWKSGEKETYIVKTEYEEIRLTDEHLVYMPEKLGYINVGSMKKGDVIFVNRNGNLIKEKIISDPILYGIEEVYDIEVPSTENFIGNNIVSHNSRWFRYLFKQN